jgi:uncharacterized protein
MIKIQHVFYIFTFMAITFYSEVCAANLPDQAGNSNTKSQQQSDVVVQTLPQEPTRPYPYNEEEVSFVNKTDGVVLAGTLTLPRSKGPFPVVVLLHGSAPLDRDETLFGHKPFLVLADHLTKQGIAVLRFDKRGAGKSAGNYDFATIENFAKDAIAAVEYLKTRKEINSKQIGLIGHSEGGMTAPLAASKSKDIAFIVSIAGPGVNGQEIMEAQIASFQNLDGVAKEMTTESLKFLQAVFAIAKEEKNREVAGTRLYKYITKYLGEATPSQRTIIETYYGKIDDQIKLFNAMWFRYFLTYEPAAVLKQIRIPVLALNGELDMVVSSKQNLTAIAKALEEAGNSEYIICELPKLNHMLQTCQTGAVKECFVIQETIAPFALTIMSEWILDKTSKIK